MYLGEKLEADSCKRFVRKVIENYQLPYITITPTFSICPKHGYIAGEHDYCPQCDVDIGYHGTKYDITSRIPYTANITKLEELQSILL